MTRYIRTEINIQRTGRSRTARQECFINILDTFTDFRLVVLNLRYGVVDINCNCRCSTVRIEIRNIDAEFQRNRVICRIVVDCNILRVFVVTVCRINHQFKRNRATRQSTDIAVSCLCDRNRSTAGCQRRNACNIC